MSTSKLNIEANVPLSRLTTLQVGGPASWYASADAPDSVRAGVAWAEERRLPLLVLGGGSNLLVADDGFPGLVLRIRLRGMHVERDGDSVLVTAAAGENWAALVNRTVERGWAGLECLAGIPGTVGATPVQNVGAYGQEVREAITAVEVLDRRTGEIRVIPHDACGFGYRASRFKGADRDRFIILKVTFRLQPGGSPRVRYGELAALLACRGVSEPTLRDVRGAVMALRREKAMLLHTEESAVRSVGSFFINPIVSAAEYALLQQVIAPVLAPGESLPIYPLPDGRVKVSAAWLIEHAGFRRGHMHGRVGLSSRHALAIVNHGNATAREVVAFASSIRRRVWEAFGVLLHPEPMLVCLTLDDELVTGKTPDSPTTRR